jgi:hypothetical protein
MKNLILFSALLYGGVALAQNDAARSFRQSLEELPVSFTLGFKKFETLPTALTIYSPSAMVTNQYMLSHSGYFRSNATNLPITLNGIAIDSFNPNGANNLQTALGMGLVRTLLKL